MNALLCAPARDWTDGRFVVAGPLYPADIAWPDNVDRVEHLAPGEHRAFYAAQRFTLNVTRADMVRRGYSPSVRLFEAALCGVPIVSDWWPGLDTFFRPGEEIVIARGREDVLAALRRMPEEERVRLGQAARARVLGEPHRRPPGGGAGGVCRRGGARGAAAGDRMRIVIFGLSVSSSWGNGHAALWRGLIRALLEAGHSVVFWERDVPYYAANRDLHELPEGGELLLYPDWEEALPAMRRSLAGADVGMVTSYCPDGLEATELVLGSDLPVRCFYDLDTPVTLARLEAGEQVGYIGPDGLAPFDLVLSYTGGGALDALRTRLGARRTAPIFGSVDPELHRPAPPRPEYRALLSYLGTYAADRQATLERLFVEPARRLPDERFVIGGAQYPDAFPWTPNTYFVRHLPPPEHPAFYCSSRLTLNVTREAMARMGWCPSGRLFEAAACGVPILSDWFAGLDTFFRPDEEILVARSTEEAMDALALGDAALAGIARRARERTLDEHTAARRATQMVAAFEAATAREVA